MNLELKIENPSWKYEEIERDGGVQYRFTFSNGYGASVVKFYGTYGFGRDLWELAVLKNGRKCIAIKKREGENKKEDKYAHCRDLYCVFCASMPCTRQ